MQQWHLIYTKPHNEFVVNRQLEDREIETFLPFLQFARGYNRGVLVEPFFPHYLFACLDLEASNATGLRWLPGVRSVVHFGSGPAVVPEQVVESLRQRLQPYADKVIRKTEWLYQPGQKLQVASGPFEGLEAVFQRGLDGSQRVQVLIHLLGRWSRVQLSLEQVKPLA